MKWYCHCGAELAWEAAKDLIALECATCNATIAVAVREKAE